MGVCHNGGTGKRHHWNMDHTFDCPACHAIHREPANAAFVLAVQCLDCELAERYHELIMPSEIVIKAAA